MQKTHALELSANYRRTHNNNKKEFTRNALNNARRPCSHSQQNRTHRRIKAFAFFGFFCRSFSLFLFRPKNISSSYDTTTAVHRATRAYIPGKQGQEKACGSLPYKGCFCFRAHAQQRTVLRVVPEMTTTTVYIVCTPPAPAPVGGAYIAGNGRTLSIYYSGVEHFLALIIPYHLYWNPAGPAVCTLTRF